MMSKASLLIVIFMSEWFLLYECTTCEPSALHFRNGLFMSLIFVMLFVYLYICPKFKMNVLDTIQSQLSR